MAEETERKFRSIMEKLYNSTPLKSPTSWGKERSALIKRKQWETGFEEEGNVLVKRAAREEERAPCRPWDRGDLMKRLATFKAMTWFGKPEVINPVNCARRGWKNIDMDTLSCESCGSRLLFSNPSSWNLQQVEKAAAVFSSKLESGHKQLCPWIDNTCEENLSYFPPTPSPVLISGFKERSSSLLQLSAFPIISSAALELIKNPQFESFLRKGSDLCYGFESLVWDDISEGEMSNMYHQAHMILSLCGWEPRPVPYIVETMANHPSIISVSAEGGERDEDRVHPPSDPCYDPRSVLLECKLCGARVGLWAFKTVTKPLRKYNLIESSDEVSAMSAQQKGPGQSLTLTIAGGPQPAKQDFKPRISLPIVTRHLRGMQEADDTGIGGKSRSQTLTPTDTVVSYADVSIHGQSQPNISEDSRLNGNAHASAMVVSDSDISIQGQSQALTLEQENERILPECSAPDMVVSDADTSIRGQSQSILLENSAVEINDADVSIPGQSHAVTSEDCLLNGNAVALDTVVNDADVSIHGQSRTILSEDTKLEKNALDFDMVVNDADVSSHGQSQNGTILSEDPQLEKNALAFDMVVNDADVSIHGQSQTNLSEESQLDENALASDVLVNDADVSIHGESQILSEDHQQDRNSCQNDADIIIHGQNEIFLSEDPHLDGNACIDALVDDADVSNHELDGDADVYDMLVNDDDVSIHGQSQSQTILSEDHEVEGNICAFDLLVNDADVSNDDQSQSQSQSQTALPEDPQLDGNAHASDMLVKDADVSNDGQTQSQTVLPEDPQIDGNAHASDMLVNDADVSIDGQSETILSEDQLDGNVRPSDVLVNDDNVSIDGQSQTRTILTEGHQLSGNVHASDVLVNDADVSIRFGQSQTNSGETGNTLSASNKLISETEKADEVNKFDPIHQHRPFCPWVAFRKNKNLPGWKLTFQALVNEKSSPLSEEKDPILSIRRLFSSPPPKRPN